MGIFRYERNPSRALLNGGVSSRLPAILGLCGPPNDRTTTAPVAAIGTRTISPREALFAISMAVTLSTFEQRALAQPGSSGFPPDNASGQAAPAAVATEGPSTLAGAAGQASPPGEGADLSLEELLNVDVTTASKFAEKQSDAPGIITVLSADDLKRFGGTTLSDILDRVPGLNASRGYLTDRSTIAARGDQVRVNSGHILLLINGRPVRETMEGGLSSDMFERFPVNAIDHIEVIKGPGSVLYGSDAFSGVINVITKDVDRTGATASGLIGTDGAYDPSGTAALRVGDFKLFMSARDLQQPRWQADYLFRNTPTAPIQTLPIDGPDKGSGAYLDASYKGLRLMAAYTNWNYWYQLKGIVSDGTWGKGFVNLGYSHQFLDNWKSDLNVTFTNATLDFSNNRPFVKRNSSELVTEWTNFVDMSKNARIVVGGLLNSREGKENNNALPVIHTTDDSRQVGFQAYAQVDYRPWRPLKLIGGIQANKVGSLPAGAVPRIGVIVSPISRINFKALFSTAYRAPSIDELFLTDVNLHGNPNLRPETVSTLDLDVSYQGDGVQVDASYFYSKQRDIIRPQLAPGATGTNGLQISTNTSGVEIQGCELEAKAYITRFIYVTASGLYQRSENDQGQVGVTPIPAVTAKAGASYMSDNGINVSLFDLVSGEYGSQFQTTINPTPGAHNDLNLHAIFGLNRFFNWRFKPDITLQLQVNNMLDARYHIPEWGGTVHDAIPGSVGRVIYGGLSLAL
jgi:outer membrane receptor for ferrienterochelin and colicins